MADVDDSVAYVKLNAPPGETEVHWHPAYNCAQSERFVESLREQLLVKVEKIGESPEGRNLWLLQITDHSPQPKKSFLVCARVHPYESASSDSMEGMVRWLLSDDAYAAVALHQKQLPEFGGGQSHFFSAPDFFLKSPTFSPCLLVGHP
jgi:hypothetical protein